MDTTRTRVAGKYYYFEAFRSISLTEVSIDRTVISSVDIVTSF